MAALSDFYKHIKTFVPGVPEPTIDFAINRAARHFCSLSWFCRRSITITLVDGQASYTLTPADSTNEEIIGVHAVEYDDKPLDPTKPELVETTEGTPKEWYTEQYTALVLNPTPDSGVAGETVQVRIAVQPTLSSESVPNDVYREYQQAIADGACAWLMKMPKQPWSDPAMAQKLERQFMAKAMRAKETALRGAMPWGLGVRRPVFAVR